MKNNLTFNDLPSAVSMLTKRSWRPKTPVTRQAGTIDQGRE